MTNIKVTQADREFADNIYDCTDMDGSCVPVVSVCAARHRVEAQRPLIEALEKALHILQYCPDKQKKVEDLIAAAIKQAKGE